MKIKTPKLTAQKLREEMYRRNLELAETNQTLSLLRKIDEVVLESETTLQQICGEIANAIVGAKGASFAGLLVTPSTKREEMKFFGHARQPQLNEDDQRFFAKVKISTEHHEWLSTNQDSALFNLSDHENTQQLHKLAGLPVSQIHEIKDITDSKYIYITKLKVREYIIGLMVLGFGRTPHAPNKEQTEFFDRLSESVGVAVDSKLLFEENKQFLAQLKHTNQKLKALDETKDEFISMASHQLRTPLTSVKGYMSMVIEGDAGKLSTQQKKLLNQAFVSSQRMVYLIADLLNVSRIKTGKFIIDATPVNLAELVEGEISQLTEVAKGKKITMSYKKPKDFPELMLDETKVRQVVMNFTDNAIYYTPSGGRIDIAVSQDKKFVYFCVKDNGLGVPKSEQSHMFSKFYRATNAKKARPDGTGLGLFMAKKVVLAQGGEILFESQENKGSTFGFLFEKSKLKVPEDIDKTTQKPADSLL